MFISLAILLLQFRILNISDLLETFLQFQKTNIQERGWEGNKISIKSLEQVTKKKISKQADLYLWFCQLIQV